ncbi:serine hydrolase [Micromonospora sp. CPCC 206060]|uniref:serine hydrolase n=1 Tax=Micromonospora sp. CPCC 206060 TaxID=3122406 RepID=UPI002FF33636
MLADDLDNLLHAVPGTVSVHVGRLDGPPTYTRLPDATHYAASTMKAAVLAALHRAADAGRLDLDDPVPVHNRFDSALTGAPRFGCAHDYDNDDAVWDRLGHTAPLRWLADRMIVRSSNLATNIVLGHVGLPAVAEVWSLVGARHSVTGRGIEDFAAREAGITNLVTAADLAALLGAIARGAATPGPLAAPAACTTMLDVLFAQEHREDLAAGLPDGAKIAHKNGWVRGVRHGAGVVFPDDAPPYTIVVCTTTDLADGGPSGEETEDDACRLIARISAAVWAARHALGR